MSDNMILLMSKTGKENPHLRLEKLMAKEMDIKCYLFPYKIQHDTAPPAGVWLSK